MGGHNILCMELMGGNISLNSIEMNNFLPIIELETFIIINERLKSFASYECIYCWEEIFPPNYRINDIFGRKYFLPTVNDIIGRT